MTYKLGQEFTVEDKINAAIAWADLDAPAHFDSSFLESLADKLEKWGSLSPAQESALDNIIASFRIDVSDYL